MGDKDMERSSSGCPAMFFFTFWFLLWEDTRELQEKESPCCVWDLVPRAQYVAASE